MEGFDLHLMRHGAPEVMHLMLGRTDAASSAGGIAACCTRAEGLVVESIISSDLARAAVPARLIANERGLTPHVDPRWRELDFGEWDGLAAGDIAPEALGRFWDDPDAYPPPGGERWSALVARVGAALAELPPRPTLVLTHGGAMRAALAALCGFGQAQTWSFDLPYGALLSLRLWPGDPITAQLTGLRT
ncbi:MAG TPA: histidine phosphatase family protein [Sphingobium sp.]|uniref:histidine phosphatase family protein n=1 Tax=Sphingobium sp. TaxID=1912891 RepID=UPI002ED18593